MELRVAVVRLTQVMRSRLLGESLRIVEQPVFACPRPAALDWKLRRRYLTAFLDQPEGSSQDQLIGLGIVIPGKMATSYERRIEIEDFEPLKTPQPVDPVRERLKSYADALRANGPLSSGRGRYLVDALAKEFPALAQRLADLAGKVAVPVPTGDAVENSQRQRDASNVLLTAHQLDRSPIRNWPSSASAANFNDEIPGAKPSPHEDDLIQHDFMHLPGWPDGVAIDWTVRRHTRGGRQLDIFYGNTRELERQTGVDLVYYNYYHGCFVLVQYKKFRVAGQELVYWPDSDHNFASELERMRKIDAACTVGARPADIQLIQAASFFKFCDPVPFEPGSQDLVPGMYLAREHVEVLLEAGQYPGQRGRRVDYEIVPRYLNNTLFTGLLGDGWIGTRGAGTDLVMEQVLTSLGQGHGIVAGVTLNLALGNAHRPRRSLNPDS